MKVQTSLEFLVIAGAIGLLVVSSLSEYSRYVSPAKSLLNVSYANYTQNATITIQNPHAVISIPLNTTGDGEGLAQIAAYGCSNGTVAVNLNSSSVVFNEPKLSLSFYGAGEWQDGFYASPGIDQVSASYALRCDDSSYNWTGDLYTVSSGQYSGQYSAYLSNRNESIIYPLENQSIMALTQSMHCTYRGFNDQPYGNQCGTSWTYMIWSADCYQRGSPTANVCVNPSDNGYSLLIPSPYTQAYSYSINLSVLYGSQMQAHLSSKMHDAPLLLGGKQVGNASIINVSSAQATPLTAAISYDGQIQYVNYTDLTTYDQALDNMVSTLDYYNNTEVTSDIQAEINQTIYAYQSAASTLISSISGSEQGCTVVNSSLVCAAQYPFYYLINVTAPGAYLHSNTVISYQGSAIRLYT